MHPQRVNHPNKVGPTLVPPSDILIPRIQERKTALAFSMATGLARAHVARRSIRAVRLLQMGQVWPARILCLAVEMMRDKTYGGRRQHQERETGVDTSQCHVS
ncbi:hypothetical protein ACLOJK_040574 [Asimina triloba]